MEYECIRKFQDFLKFRLDVVNDQGGRGLSILLL